MDNSYFRATGNGTYELAGYIMTDKEIDRTTEKQIAEKYPYSEEQKLRRLALNALLAGEPEPAEYTEYNSHVNNCIAEGKAKKQAAAELMASLTDAMLPQRVGEPIPIKVIE